MEKKKRMSLRRSLSMRVGAGNKKPAENSTQADSRPPQSARRRGSGDPTGRDREAVITIDADAAGSGIRYERGRTACVSGFRGRGSLPVLGVPPATGGHCRPVFYHSRR